MSTILKNKTIWTIGHSTHELEKFVKLLKAHNIEIVADIRSLPGSHKYPQFNKENLELTLPANGIKYIHSKELGGRRKALKNSPNKAWQHESFRGYADYMETGEFRLAILGLEQMAENNRVAYMCSESLWWRCHRSMVSDYLKAKGWEVLHIMSNGKSTPHSYTKPAQIINGELTYRVTPETLS